MSSTGHPCNDAIAQVRRTNAAVGRTGAAVAGFLNRPPGRAIGDLHMRAIVTCECCGHRQTVDRPIRAAESFYIVCHACERSLRVEVTAQDIASARVQLPQRPAMPAV